MKKGSFLKGKTILITGGTGSWGNQLIKRLLDSYDPREVRIYSRGEHRQVEVRRYFQDERLTFYVGDVRDRLRLEQAMAGADYVFHLAALKHVPVCEQNPWEAVQTNVVGTENVITAAEHAGVKKVIYVSFGLLQME